MKPVLGQIVRLTKSLLLSFPGVGTDQPCAQFMPGKDRQVGSSGGIVATWWYSDQTFDAVEAVARLIIRSSAEYQDCDSESVRTVVTETMQEVCADRALFDVDAVLFGRRGTLFDCLRVPVPQYADAVLKAMQSNLTASIGNHCTVFAVPRLVVSSFSIPCEKVHVIAINDRAAWQSMIDRGYRFDTWSPASPLLGGRRFTPAGSFRSVLVSEDHGTSKGARFSSTLKFRKLLAVLVAIISDRARRTYHPSAAHPVTGCMQFPHASNADGSRAVLSDCGTLLPHYVSDIDVAPEDVQRLNEWYDDCEKCNPKSKDRIKKAAHFLNRAMNAEDIEAYVNYFVALDALFGQRGSVEKSILRGVAALGLGQPFVERAARLFAFRNEIVHGSSRYISECPGYDRYVEHFNEEPGSDLQRLAQLAVIGAPRLTASQWLTIAAGPSAELTTVDQSPADSSPRTLV